MKNYLKYRLFCIFQSPLFYIISFAYNIFCPVYFFLIKNFFGGNGSTELYNFFSFSTAVSSVIIPLFALNVRNFGFEEFVPVSSLEKYFSSCIAVLVQFSAMILPQFLLPCCLNLFGTVDAGSLFTGFLFLELYAFTAAACCIFLQSLINSYAAAFFSGCIILGITSGINFLMIYANPVPFLAFCVKALSLLWHFDSALKGIFDSRDFFYFVFISAFFTVGSVITDLHRRGYVFSASQKRCILYILVIIVFGFANTAHFYVRHDVSAEKKATVSAYTKSILNLAEDTVYISYYRSSLLNDLYPQSREIHDYLYELSLLKNIHYDVKSPEKDGGAELLQKYGIYGRQFKTNGNNSTEFTTVYSTIVIEYAGKWEVIPFILLPAGLEYDLNVRLDSLIAGKKRIVNILCGNGLSLKNDYSYVLPWLNSQGFICNEIELNENLSSQFKYSDLLMVFGSSMLTQEHCAQIETFVENGGKLFALANRYSSDIENSWYITENKNQYFIDFLEKNGFGFRDELCADISSARITMTSDENSEGKNDSVTRTMNYPLWISVLPQKNAPSGITLFWCESVEALTEGIQPLFYSSAQGWKIAPDRNSTETLFLTNPFGINELKFSEERQVLALGLYSSGKNKIILIPDQYFVNSLMLGYTGGQTGDYRNLDFMVNALLKLNGEPELAELHQKGGRMSSGALYKTYDIESFVSAKNRTLFCMFILNPLIILGFCVFMRIQRKKAFKSAGAGGKK